MKPAGPGTLKLTIAYDGAGFAGAQAQPGQRTVQEELERALTRLYGRHERATLAGRTDSGVHAAGQVVSVADRRADLDVATLTRALNAILPEDLAIRGIERIDEPFHARFDARWREYRYRIWTGLPAPLARTTAWQIARQLEFEAMVEASRALIGEHDFAAFAGGGEGVPWSERQQTPRGTVRRVYDAGMQTMDPWWWPKVGQGELIDVRIVADAFLPRMVRNVVGALVEIGCGRASPDWVATLLTARDRRLAGMTAPAHGLILWRVGYGDEAPPTA